MLPTITIDGRLVADPELRFTQGGKAVCSFRVAASDSKKDASGNWETTEQIFIGISLWEAEAEVAAEHYMKGDRVVVTGRIYEREYEASNGEKRKSLELKFPTIAKKIAAPRGERASAPAPASNDPWATVAPHADQPPF